MTEIVCHGCGSEPTFTSQSAFTHHIKDCHSPRWVQGDAFWSNEPVARASSVWCSTCFGVFECSKFEAHQKTHVAVLSSQQLPIEDLAIVDPLQKSPEEVAREKAQAEAKAERERLIAEIDGKRVEHLAWLAAIDERIKAATQDLSKAVATK